MNHNFSYTPTRMMLPTDYWKTLDGIRTDIEKSRKRIRRSLGDLWAGKDAEEMLAKGVREGKVVEGLLDQARDLLDQWGAGKDSPKIQQTRDRLDKIQSDWKAFMANPKHYRETAYAVGYGADRGSAEDCLTAMWRDAYSMAEAIRHAANAIGYLKTAHVVPTQYFREIKEGLSQLPLEFDNRKFEPSIVSNLTKTEYDKYRRNLGKDSASSYHNNYIYAVSHANVLQLDAKGVQLLRERGMFNEEKWAKDRPNLTTNEEIATKGRVGLHLYLDRDKVVATWDGIQVENYNVLFYQKVAPKLIDGNAVRFVEESPAAASQTDLTMPEDIEHLLDEYTAKPFRKLHPAVKAWFKANIQVPSGKMTLYRGIAFESFNIPADPRGWYDKMDAFSQQALGTPLREIRKGAQVVLRRGKESSWSPNPQIAAEFANSEKWSGAYGLMVRAEIPTSKVVFDFRWLPMHLRTKFNNFAQNEVIVDGRGGIKGTIVYTTPTNLRDVIVRAEANLGGVKTAHSLIDHELVNDLASAYRGKRMRDAIRDMEMAGVPDQVAEQVYDALGAHADKVRGELHRMLEDKPEGCSCGCGADAPCMNERVASRYLAAATLNEPMLEDVTKKLWSMPLGPAGGRVQNVKCLSYHHGEWLVEPANRRALFGLDEGSKQVEKAVYTWLNHEFGAKLFGAEVTDRGYVFIFLAPAGKRKYGI